MGQVVSLEGERGRKPSLDGLVQLVEGDLERVNNLIIERMKSPVALIPKLAGHLIAAGGKRLRPMLTLAASRLAGYTGERPIRIAACVEFIHTATLLHDDVVDQGERRRGLTSANRLWGNSASVLVGDFLFSRAFELMVEDGSLKVLAILSRASSVIAEGEVLQLTTANDVETSETLYLDVIKAKTAELFAAACRLGPVIAERPEVEEKALEAYGMNLGIAFQAIDDVLDYAAKQAVFGKTIGNDFSEGKMTLPVVLAYRRGNDEERQFWRRTVNNLDQKPGDFERAVALMEKHGALADAVARARHYGSIARDSIGIFSDGPPKAALLDLIDFCIERAY